MVQGLFRVAPGTMLLGVLIPNTVYGGYHPHRTDIYIPKPLEDGSPGYTRALVSLHGGAGDSVSHARHMEVLTDYVASLATVNWELLEFWHMAAIFPQGQACVGPGQVQTVNADGSPRTYWPVGGNPWNPYDVDTRTAPTGKYPNGIYGWSNGFMRSGADDKQYLKDAKTFITGTMGSIGVSLNGHSNGGFMVKLMMYESPLTFTHLSSISGPPAVAYLNTALPGLLRPCLSITGRKDDTTGVLDYADGSDHLFDVDGIWDQNPHDLIPSDVAYPALGHYESEWHFLIKRAAAAGFTAVQGDGVVTNVHFGTQTEWKYDLGNQTARVYSEGAHDMVSIRKAIGHKMFSVIAQWINQT